MVLTELRQAGPPGLFMRERYRPKVRFFRLRQYLATPKINLGHPGTFGRHFGRLRKKDLTNEARSGSVVVSTRYYS